MLQKWQNPYDLNEPPASRDTSWFKKQYSAKGSKKKWGGNQGASSWGRSKYSCSKRHEAKIIYVNDLYVNLGSSQWFHSGNIFHQIL